MDQTMKSGYRLYRRDRGGFYCAHDALTGKQESLKTRNRPAAQRLIAAKNTAVEQPQLDLALARTYLAAHDPRMITRCWQEVMDQYASRGRDSTRDRSARAFKGAAFDHLRNRVIVQTVAGDFLTVMKNRGPSIPHYLRRLQNLALTLAPHIPTQLGNEEKSTRSNKPSSRHGHSDVGGIIGRDKGIPRICRRARGAASRAIRSGCRKDGAGSSE